MKLSVILPVYNSAKYLDKCIKSILNQTLKEMEIIIINDGSTDNSLDIIKSYGLKDDRIKIVNQDNKGVSASRNIGIKLATGDYIINIDSDDWVEEHYFEDIYNFASNKKLDILVTDIHVEGSGIDYIQKDLNISDERIINGKEYLEVFFKNNLYGFTWNKLIRRELYDGILYREDLTMCEDVYLIVQIIKKAKYVGKINYAYYHYIQNNTSITNTLNVKKLQDVYEVFSFLKNYFSNDKLLTLYIKEQEICALLYIIINMKNCFFDKKRQEIWNAFLKMVKQSHIQYTDFRYKKKLFLCYKLIKCFPFSLTIWFLIFIDKIYFITKKLKPGKNL